MLRFSGICAAYGATQVLQDISCSVESGRVLAIVGRSGMGKSTLLSIASGVRRPESGSVFFNGQDVTGRRGFATFMQQDDLLLPYLTIADNVALPLQIRRVSKRIARDRAHDLLARFSLAAYSGYYPAQLSGGMRQRAAIMRAFIASSSVLLMDEPFARLDAVTKRECELWCKSVWESFGTTVVLVTHDVSEALRLADYVAVLRGHPARLVFFESTARLMQEHSMQEDTDAKGWPTSSEAAQARVLSFL